MPWTLFETDLGTCGLAWSDAGVTWFQLPESTPVATQDRLLAKTGEASLAKTSRPPPWITQAITKVKAHLAGRPQDLRAIPLDLTGSNGFTTRLYRALQEVPAGATVSYGELARKVESPGAARAVGRAMATNPVPLLVPCHRVLAAGGKPGGFSAYGGVLTKDRILALEGWRAPKLEDPLFAAAREDTLPYDAAAAHAHLEQADTVLGAHIARVGGFALRLKQTEGTFAALAEAIVYQQLHAKAAATIFARVQALFPHGRLAPRAFLSVSDDDLRAAGLSRSKLAALRDLSRRGCDGEIPTLAQLQKMDDESIVERLTTVRGIGRWTVEMLLIFRLGRPDVLPTADYGIKKGFAHLFHRGARRAELPTEADLHRRGERWKPFRSVASWYLWRAADG